MKNIFCLIMIVCSMATNAQSHKLTKLWETDTTVAIPESVLPDFSKNILYISLIDGNSWEADGKGGIAKLGMDGKNYQGNWISGLNAPKGMGIIGNKMYVADMNEVLVIDIKKGKVEKRIAPDSAKGMNDISIDSKGIVYASDSKTGNIWRIENDNPILFLQNMKGVNGLKAIGDELFILSGKSFVKSNSAKEISKITELPQGGDGIEPIGNGDFIVTSWAGYIYYVEARGKTELLLDTHEAKKNTADIGYDPVKKILYVPTFNGKQVVAYKLD